MSEWSAIERCLRQLLILQIRDEYEAVKDLKASEQPANKRAAVANGAAPSLGGATEIVSATEDAAAGRSTTARLLDSIAAAGPRCATNSCGHVLSTSVPEHADTQAAVAQSDVGLPGCICLHS